MENRLTNIRNNYLDLIRSGTDIKGARQFLLYHADDIPAGSLIRELIICLADLSPYTSSKDDREIMALVKFIYKSWKKEYEKESLCQKTQ